MDYTREMAIRADLRVADDMPENPLPICGRCTRSKPKAGPCPDRAWCKEIMVNTLLEAQYRFNELAPTMALAMAENPVADMLSGTDADQIMLRITRGKETEGVA